MAGIQLTYSHRLQTLACELAAQLEGRLSDPGALFQPVDIIVPNWNMRTYLEQEISRLLGVTPNLRFRLLRGFLADVLPHHRDPSGDYTGDKHQQGPRTRILGRKQLQHILVDLLEGTEGGADEPWLDGCPEIRDYLDVDDRIACERRLYQLSGELARIFTEYSFSRSQPVFGPTLDEEPLLVRWRRLGASGRDELDGVERWQQVLWWRVFGDAGVLEEIEAEDNTRLMTLADALAEVSPDDLDRVPPTIHVVGFSYIARLFIEAIGLLGERADVHVHALSPCGRWIDEAPADLDTSDDHLLLKQWGRAGADHAGMWKSITNATTSAQERTRRRESPQNLLEALQNDIIGGGEDEAPTAVGRRASGWQTGVRFFECPSIKREVESVKNEIWTLLRDEPSLRPDDVAVVIAGADRDAYAAQIESVFSSARYLPHTSVDLPSSSPSRVLEAASLLLALPFGRFTRRDLLRLLVHPNLLVRSDEVDPGEWVRWCERLGILYAANREEQTDSYLGGSFEVGKRPDYEWDLYNWDQGLRRLVLGTFLSGERSGVDELFEVEKRDYEPLEIAAAAAPEAARFVALVSSIIEDARWLVGTPDRRPRRRAAEWSDIVDAYLTTYLSPDAEDADAYEFSACRRIVRQVAEQCPVDSEMTYQMFFEFVREELEELQKTGASFLTGGVVVSACLPLRAIPFDHVFVMGLGEGQFPNPEHRDPLDLRHDNPQRGDLAPADRDRYTFLETLLAARKGLTLSWVAREATTGEPLEASSVVNELRWVLEHRFGIPAESARTLTVRHPLRRFDYQYFPTLARTLGKPELAEPCAAGEDGRTLDLLTPSPSLHPEARAEARLQALRERLADSGDGRVRNVQSLDDLRSLLCDPMGDEEGRLVWQRLRRELALPRLPSDFQAEAGSSEAGSFEAGSSERAPTETNSPRRVRLTLSKLRAFLESPLQGAAKVQLGLRDDADDPFGVEREPLQANSLHRAIALREVVDHALRTATTSDGLAALYEELLFPRATLAGGLPSGDFLARDRDSHIATLEAWWANFDYLDIEPPLNRVGIGVDPDSAGHKLEAIEIELAPHEHGVPEAVIVEISGVTEATSPDGEAYVCFAENTSASPGERYFLRCFLSWIAATAAGRPHPDEVRLVVATTKDHSSSRAKTLDRFTRRHPAWSTEKATDYLARLSASLLFDSHDYLLPIQFVQAACGKSDGVPDTEQLKDWLEGQLASSYCSASFKYGPIKDYRRFGAPRDVDVAETIRTRFPHLFSEIS